MVKPSLILLFSLSLTFSILVPSILNMLNFEFDEIVLIDAKEESQKKEVETNIEKDIKIVQSLPKIPNFYLDEDLGACNFYVEDSSIFTSSIHLPPPEHFI